MTVTDGAPVCRWLRLSAVRLVTPSSAMAMATSVSSSSMAKSWSEAMTLPLGAVLPIRPAHEG